MYITGSHIVQNYTKIYAFLNIYNLMTIIAINTKIKI
jgi:hypothetical protein